MAAIVKNKFTTTGYTADNGLVYKIRISNQARALQTTADTGPTPTVRGSALVGGSRKRAGLHARGFRLTRTVGASPNAVSYTTFLPILLAADYAGTADGALIVINGVQWTVEKHIAEEYR